MRNGKQASAIVYVVGRTPTIASMRRSIELNWDFIAPPEIYLHDDGFFLIKFASISDRDEVLCSGPYFYANAPIITKAWEPNFKLNDEVLKVVPLWVKFPNLPLNCWGADTLSRIANVS